MSTISVIIPAYNAETYIAEAIESALNQTRPAAEVIVVDDASTDQTAEIGQSYGKRVTLIQLPKNSGVAVARNRGVEYSASDFIAYLDADDYWDCDHVEHLAGLLDHNRDAGMAFCQVKSFGAQSGLWPSHIDKYLEPGFRFFEVLRNIPCIPSAMMIRRCVHEQIYGYDEASHWYMGKRVQAEDLDYVIRACLHTKVIASPHATCCYRVHDAQSSTIRSRQILQAFKYRLAVLEQVRRMDKPVSFVARAVDRVLMCWEEHLEESWRMRDMPALAAMIKLGICHRLLRSSTLSYLPKLVARGLWAR